MADKPSTGDGRRIVLVAVSALLVAEVAVWLLQSRQPILPAAATSASEWFTPTELERMLAFREPQRLLALAGSLFGLAFLAFLAWWAPPRLVRFLPRRPLLAAALIAAGISVTAALVSLPLGLVMLERAREAELVTQSVGPWLADRARSLVIGAVIAAVGGGLAILTLRRLGRRWWIGGWALVVAYAVVFTWFAPLLIAPLFNRFEPLPEGPARTEILDLADQAGVEVGDVLVVDAARRSSAINAYVSGLGSSKRVVVYDNALGELERGELRAVLAHELSHVKEGDVPRAVLWVALVAPLGVLFVQLGSARIAAAHRIDPTSPAALPGLALCLALAIFVLGILGAQLSRQVEARADTFALELTGEPREFIGLQRRLAASNLSDPDPSWFWSNVFATHPYTLERIGFALTYEDETGG